MQNRPPKSSLRDLYQSASQCVVAFINKMAKAPSGQSPTFPSILGTGFLVNSKGLAVTNRHVIQALESLPLHPNSRESTAGAFLLAFDELGRGCHAVFPAIIGFAAIDSFKSGDDSNGSSIPDIGFVQLAVRDTPFLKLNSDDFAIEPGMDISTIGFPIGNPPLTLHKKVGQVSPFVRRGIVSSVYPGLVANPDCFTIDIMQQGGSSGSPIFGPDNERVVGMMWGGVPDRRAVVMGSTHGYMELPSNISLAEPARIIADALAEAAKYGTVQVSEVPTLQALQHANPVPNASMGLEWEILQPK
jgi:S1-C subfamily serine protease